MNRERLETSFAFGAESWWIAVKARVGSKNRYVCSVERTHIVITVDRDAGATPGVISCGTRFVPEGCMGHMRSRFYNTNQNAKPGWEWYRPEADADGRFGKNQAQHEHVMNGGLVLRPLPELACDVALHAAAPAADFSTRS